VRGGFHPASACPPGITGVRYYDAEIVYQYRESEVLKKDTLVSSGGLVNGDAARIVAGVKTALKTRGVTYAQLARRIGLSEASVKRVLARGTLSLRRLEQICEAIGTSVAEVVLLTRSSTSERAETLTLEQEKSLAADPQLFACYHLVANGRSSGEHDSDHSAGQRTLATWI
jgi:lambda repressor-like predicted transcriptional regulator